MPSVRDLKRRIRSVQNTGKVTNAMSLIAASKMRHAQGAVLQGRPFASKIQEIIADLAAQPRDEDSAMHPLLQVREVKRIGVLTLTPDRGLCGGLASNLNRRVAQFILAQTSPVRLIVVGRKGRDFMVRYGQDVNAVFTDLGDRPTLADTTAISGLLSDAYTNGELDEVYLAYTRFVSTMNQEPAVDRLLPVTPAALTSAQRVGYIYEPDALTVLGSLLPRFVEMEVYHALLEAIASEQSARMVAMRNATDNSKSLVGDLTLDMNKLRQNTITNELLDLVGGQVAMEG
ncbi:MAG: ATP synthase F1 subunit gamma [Dehalococcoidia bacterium]|nr:ATP synthase F1 subunit gamma [Dehalococcoidia bacterium]MSQ17067.1 ATP synthase F1 subunit gamma [Dehalococcoidia bacterium]